MDHRWNNTYRYRGWIHFPSEAVLKVQTTRLGQSDKPDFGWNLVKLTRCQQQQQAIFRLVQSFKTASQESALLFVASILIGIGVGVVITSLISREKE